MQLSFLIRTSPDQRLFASFPELIAGYHVLHRLSMPRHPPYTLSSLTTFIDHRHNGRVMTGAVRSTTSLPRGTINNGSRSPKRCSTIPARRKNSNTGVGITPYAGAGIAVRSSSCAAARRLICLTTTTGGSLPLNLTYSLVKEHLVLRRQPLDRSSSTVTGFARRTRVSVPCQYEADLLMFGASSRRTATDRFTSVFRGFASPTSRQ